MALGWPSLNLIVAGELIRLSSAFAIRLGASGDLGLGIGAATNVQIATAFAAVHESGFGA